MGHIHLGVLPQTKKWREVVALLSTRADDADVLAASAVAAERELATAPDNPVFVEALRLLFMLPHAARSNDFGRALTDIGLDIGSAPELTDILAAASERLDRVARQNGNRTDFGELAGRALVSTLSMQIGDTLPGLFDATPADVQNSARRLAAPRGISDLARAYFGRLLSECLSSWLSRTLSTQIGEGQRFQHIGERALFDIALAQYTREATRIISEFAPGWYGKRLHLDGEITTGAATIFGAVAFKKITAELRRKRGGDD